MRILLIFSLLISLNARPASQDDNITQKWAQARRKQVQDVHYELVFELKKSAQKFEGKAILLVNLKNSKLPLKLDLVADKIHSLTVNGKEIKKFVRGPHGFEIPASVLTHFNKIEILYTGLFSKEANGFQRSVDPEDGSEYLFTDFEPYYAHKLFPCFDQPDIKGTYQVIVKAPSDWKIITNEIVSNSVTEKERTTTFFPTTKPISSYLFFLGAGPYVEWTDTYKNIPLTLYARKTIAKHVDHENIFTTTKKGLEFFTEYFGYPYPFSKYGQIFIPEFAWGGMENPGAVTLNERNIFRGPVPQAKLEDRDNLILHEMAHMWFGDLVTMEWWNDLWLNESFATYTASLAQDRGMRSSGTWQDFFNTKTWGYWQDQLVTTHPIETPVPDVRTAKGNFDGITYAKGASALKQLHFFVGETGFKQGLQAYFKTYAFKNTRRSDFINEIAKASQIPLTDWTKKWLQTAGPNRVKLSSTCKDGKILALSLAQAPNASKALSPHRTRLGLYEIKDGKLVQFRTHDVIYDQKKTSIKELEGTRCPDFILPNQDDQDYALFTLDPASLKHAPMALSFLEDPLSRLMIWNILYQMVRDGDLAPLEFLTFAQTALREEKDDLLLYSAIGPHSPVRSVYQTYLNMDERTLNASTLENIIWKRVMDSKPASSLQMTFFDFYTQIVQSPEGVLRLMEMLEKNNPPKGITIDQDRRWTIVSALATNGVKSAEEIVLKEKAKDTTTMGERMAFGAKAGIPSGKIKKEYLDQFFSTKEIPYTHFRQAAQRIHSPNNLELSEKMVDTYFDRVKKMDWQKNDAVVDIYFEALFPYNICSPELLRRSQRELKKARNLTPLAKRGWLEANDELGRCVRVRKPMLKAKPNA